MFNGFYDEINRLNKKDTRFISTGDKIAKMQEEFGEYCEAYLIQRDLKLSKQNSDKSQTREHLLEENVDMLIQVASLLQSEGFTLEEITRMTLKKLRKWETNLDEHQEKTKEKYLASIRRDFLDKMY